jgi:hypothetical protein
VQPGNYAENLTLAAGVHVQSAVDERSFAVNLSGTVTVNMSGVASLDGFVVSGPSGTPTLSFSGGSFEELFLNNTTVYSNGAPALVMTNTGAGSRIEAKAGLIETTSGTNTAAVLVVPFN